MNDQSRRGYTLIELLVVTVILGSVMSLMVRGARTSSGAAGDIRRGAQQIASVLLASQSLALGSPNGAAVIIDSEGASGEVISHARRFPFIEGRVQDFKLASALTGTVSLSPENDDTGSLVHGYRIRFMERTGDATGPASAWFSFSCTTAPAAAVSLRWENGQTSQTTLWPSQPESGSLLFEVARYPIPTGLTEALPTDVAIDLRYSGCGDTSLANWGSLAQRGAIAVGFDSLGSMDALMQNVLPAAGTTRTIQPISPHEGVYFLITSLKEIQDPTVYSLASDKAIWVVVHPKSGRVTMSANVPQTNPPQANDAAAAQRALRAAREKALKGIAIGG